VTICLGRGDSVDRYVERIKYRGITKRERDANYTRDFLRRRLPDSLSFKPVKLNGVDTNMVIDKGTQPYYKKFRSYLNDQKVLVGDYVEWASATWLVAKADPDNELYVDGMLYQCNYKLRWQDETGKIVERWSFVQNASAYNTGKEYFTETTVGTNQYMLMMPIDEDTRKLRRDKRVYCDIIDQKTRYKFARVDSLANTFGEKGIVTIMLTEDQAHNETDNDELGICDYIAPSSASQGEPISGGTEGYSYIDYKSTSVRCGGLPQTYTAVFCDKSGNKLNNITASWKVDCDYDITQKVNGNQITLSCSDTSAIGEIITLKITNAGYESSLEIDIDSLR
jgi:hypothetical protein